VAAVAGVDHDGPEVCRTRHAADGAKGRQRQKLNEGFHKKKS
jgi:hypothetical protein